MRRLLPVLAGCVALTGCSGDEISRGGVVAGTTLTVYSSLPVPAVGAAADVVAGQKLALAERGGRAGRFAVNFASVDEAAAAPADAEQLAAETARAVIHDTQTVAVIGGYRTAETRTTAPLYNEAGLLQVAVGAGYPGLTGSARPAESERYEPSARQTFARIVGDDAAQAEAIVAAAARPVPRQVGGRARPAPSGRALALEHDSSEEARVLAAAVLAAADRADVGVVEPERADAVVYAGEDRASAAGAVARLARAAPRATLVLPDALARAGVAAELPAAVRRRTLLVTAAPAPPPGFTAAFGRAFDRRPGPYAALGYVAMRRVLDAIAAAGPRAGERQAVIDAFFRGTDPAVDRSGARIEPRFRIIRAGDATPRRG